MRFDKVSFVKYMKNIGGRYSNQAIELISICRDLQAHEQSRESDVRLRGAIEVADAALQAAVEAQTKTSPQADEKFEEAVTVLVAFENEPVSDQQRDGIASRMAAARWRDRSKSNYRNSTSNQQSEQQQRQQQRVVEFVLFRSLPDDNPVVVKQVLDSCSSLQEVLWNFNRFTKEKRLALGQNPHFYRHLHTSRESYRKRFRLDPSEDFQDTGAEKFYVLTDRPGRIYIESGGGALAYGNVWAPGDAIIFKDVRGSLWGEDFIGQYIDTPNLRYCLLGSVSPTSESRVGHTLVPRDLSNILPTSSTNDARWKSIRDWREPIRLVLNSLYISILIDAIPFGPSRTLPLPHSPDFSLPIRRGHSDGTPTRNVPQRQGTQEGALTEETRILFQGLYVEGSTSSSAQPPLYRQ